MGEVRIEFEQAIKKLGFKNNTIEATSKERNGELYKQLFNQFVIGEDRRWWWESFKDSFRFIDYKDPFLHLNEIIPDLNTKVWLMIEDDQEDFYPIYDTSPIIIKEILAECFGFEYYIINKEMEWLICENHHNNLIGIGDILKKLNIDKIDS